MEPAGMKILFLCVANSARSQMAEGLARSILGEGVTAASAGSEPSGQVNPFAVQVMREIGVDMTHHRSKGWDELSPFFLDSLDFVVGLCAEEVCPTVASKAQRIQWTLPDPATMGRTDFERLEAFRRTRDEIGRRLVAFKRGEF